MINILKKFKIYRSNLSLSVLFKYLKREIVIILVLCSGTVLIYGILNKSLETQIINVNKVLMQNTIDSIEKEFSNMNELISLINSNPRVIRHMNMPHKQNDQNYNAYQVKEDLNTYVYSTSFIKGIQVFFDNDDVISNEYKTEVDFYYEHLDQRKYDVKSLISTFNHRRLVYTKGEDDSLENMYCVSSLPVGNRNIWRATVFIEIDMDVIASILSSNQFTETTETVLLNPEQMPILRHNPSEESWDSIDVIKTSVQSQDLGWMIESIIPETEFEAEFLSIKSIIMSILFLSLAMGLVFAVFFSYKHYQPVARLIGIVGDNKTNVSNEDIFNQIEESMSNTINENKELKSQVQRQTEHLTNNAVEQLLNKGIIVGEGTHNIIT